MEIMQKQIENRFTKLKEIFKEYKMFLENVYNLNKRSSFVGTIEGSYFVVDKESQMKWYKAELEYQK